jgi:hypothetical protein
MDIYNTIGETIDDSAFETLAAKLNALLPCNKASVDIECNVGEVQRLRTYFEFSGMEDTMDSLKNTIDNITEKKVICGNEFNTLLYYSSNDYSEQAFLNSLNEYYSNNPLDPLRKLIQDRLNLDKWLVGKIDSTEKTVIFKSEENWSAKDLQIAEANREWFLGRIESLKMWVYTLRTDDIADTTLRKTLNDYKVNFIDAYPRARSCANTLFYNVKGASQYYQSYQDAISRFADYYVKSLVTMKSIASSTSTTVDFTTRGKYFITADLGLANIPAINTVVPTFGLNFSLAALNRDARYNLKYLVYGSRLSKWNDKPEKREYLDSKFGTRFLKSSSMVLAITLRDISTSMPSRIMNTFTEIQPDWNFSLLTGFGFRISDGVRLQAGAVWVKDLARQPLNENAKFQRLFYYSLSIDLDWGKYLKFVGSEVFPNFVKFTS